jgi:hypothetical protein
MTCSNTTLPYKLHHIIVYLSSPSNQIWSWLLDPLGVITAYLKLLENTYVNNIQGNWFLTLLLFSQFVDAVLYSVGFQLIASCFSCSITHVNIVIGFYSLKGYPVICVSHAVFSLTMFIMGFNQDHLSNITYQLPAGIPVYCLHSRMHVWCQGKGIDYWWH